ncbi:FliI/YscN family ATPase [Paracoccaceae bacterium]|nr:FliI/YscN family ATPase [Paracoccaceae bacterium]
MDLSGYSLNQVIDRFHLTGRLSISGRVTKYDGHFLECDGFPANLGSICSVSTSDGSETMAEIIGFRKGNNILSMFESDSKIQSGAKVSIVDDGHDAKVGESLLGRVVDAMGNPYDGKPLGSLPETWPLNGKFLNPLARNLVDKPLDVGVRAINSLVTVGRGQRIGIVAGSGVGKSVLLGMMCRYTEADVVVVGLIGERGREVGSFVNNILSGKAKDKTVVVAVPADRSPLLRIRGANRATAISEYFRSKGKNVLLIMDSLTRVAHARREIGLALGEQPTAKGYPPSVVSLIPKLIERSGPGIGQQGSITSFYTVLADGDDENDPVVDTARAILDGHIILSRQQAQLGIYPAIDIQNSVSRVMNEIIDETHSEYARIFRKLITLYLENRDLILMGGYTQGKDPDLDLAVSLWPNLTEHIRQLEGTSSSFEESKTQLFKLLKG